MKQKNQSLTQSSFFILKKIQKSGTLRRASSFGHENKNKIIQDKQIFMRNTSKQFRNDESKIIFKKLPQVNPQNKIVSIIDDYFKEDNQNILVNKAHSYINRRKVTFKLNNQQQVQNSQNKKDIKIYNLPQIKPKQSTSLSPNKKLQSIHEITQQGQEIKQNNQILSIFNLHQNQNKQYNQYEKIIYKDKNIIQYGTFKNNKIIKKSKQFQRAGIEILQRHNKARKQGAQSAWKQKGLFALTLQLKKYKPLSDQIRKITLQKGILRVKPRKLYFKLLSNKCHQLKLLLRNICIKLQNLQGKVINNNINIGSIYFSDDQKLVLSQWCFSSYRQNYQIGNNTFQRRLDGILRSQQKWFVAPQYLAPQILSNLLGQHVQFWQDSSPDIWSLGLVIFQILTLIPLGQSQKCINSFQSNKPRSGILGNCGFDIKNLFQKQNSIKQMIHRLLRCQIVQQYRDDELFNIVQGMLEKDIKKRISYRDIIQRLSV